MCLMCPHTKNLASIMAQILRGLRTRMLLIAVYCLVTPETKKVILTSCGDPPPGCIRNESYAKNKFPECCTLSCVKLSHNCLTPNGELVKDGERLNLSTPCEGYRCNHGNLTTETCEKPQDPACYMSLAGNGVFPECCGTKACTSGSNGRKKNRQKRSRRNITNGENINGNKKKQQKQ